MSETCDDPRCSDPAPERRAEIDRTAAEHERELRRSHGPAIPERLLHARLPANEQPAGPLGTVRRDTFKANLGAALDRALDDPDRPVPESPDSPASRAGLIAAACAACRGSCCRFGGDHAYLYPDHFRRLLRDRPGRGRDEILADYLARLPAEAYRDSCVYHTPAGCALPRGLRSNLCNTFLCGGLEELIAAEPAPVLALCFKDHSAVLVRSAVFDDRGRPLLP